ncbi:MAG: dynamin family protein [Selenomonadaceae bacterium]|nr:dynamin family protein [Selenomonadaceae bacterium]
MEFKNQQVAQEYQDKVAQIQQLIDAPIDDTRYAWDATVQKAAVKIEQIKKVLGDELLSDTVKNSSRNLTTDIDAFLKRCANPEFHIALVGTIKAGKSTLINAILNDDLASTNVTPETAALTKFMRDVEDSVTISFYTSAEWDQLWASAAKDSSSVFVEDYNRLNAESEKSNWIGKAPIRHDHFGSRQELKTEIERWTSSKSPVHYFVKEVIVGLKNFQLPEGMILVDTPGLDDVVEFRSNITRDYINRANAVLACVKSDSLTGGELQTLQSIFTNTFGHPEKVYVIATQLDTLNHPEKDWAKQVVEWTKYLKSKNCYGDPNLAQRNIIPTAAFVYSLLEKYRNNEIEEESETEEDLYWAARKFGVRRDIDEHFDELIEKTGIRAVHVKLQNDIVPKYREIVLQDIRGKYEQCLSGIRELAQNQKSEQEELIRKSELDLDQIRKERENQERLLANVQADKRDLELFIRDLRQETERRINDVVNQIKNAG